MNFHGGNIYDYQVKIIDYSSNINPRGVPDSFKESLLCNLEEFTKYPDINYVSLRQAIAEYLGLKDIDRVVPGNGAIELLYRAIQKSGKSRLIGLRPTFSEYAKAAALHGIEFQGIDAFDEEYRQVCIDKLVEQADRTSAVLICNPNNPTGTLVKKQQMQQLAAALMTKEALLIIDEAFMEFTSDYPSHSMMDQLQNYENVIVIKAATKFFGMPGIRLGYAISSNRIWMKDIKESMEPWNVNTAAVIAGCTVLKDQAYIAASRAWVAQEREFMYLRLREIPGIKVYPSEANFHLIQLLREDINAWKLKDRLLESNILIRTPEGFEGLDGRFARVAVKDRQSNEIFLNKLYHGMKI